MAAAVEAAVDEPTAASTWWWPTPGVGPPGQTMKAMDLDRCSSARWRSTCSGVVRTVHPALEPIAARGGQVVVISSVYAFATGSLVTPYATAKAGVEALGRALRVELAPHGAGATVAHFGFVDTSMVQEAHREERARRACWSRCPRSCAGA